MTRLVNSFEIIQQFMQREDSLRLQLDIRDAEISSLRRELELQNTAYVDRGKRLDEANDCIDALRSAFYRGQNDYDNIRDNSMDEVKAWMQHCNDNFCAFPDLYERAKPQTLAELEDVVRRTKAQDEFDDAITHHSGDPK